MLVQSMTKFLIILLAAFALVVLVLLLLSFTSNNIETPDYKVLKTIGKVEIRKYP
jgi:hypothetical protein